MNIGARIGVWSGGSKWKNPYITDGLVAMWDLEGSEVVGESKDGWVDVVGGRIITAKNGAKLGDDGLVITAQNQYALFPSGFSDSSFVAAEIVFKRKQTTTANFCLFVFNSGVAKCIIMSLIYSGGNLTTVNRTLERVNAYRPRYDRLNLSTPIPSGNQLVSMAIDWTNGVEYVNSDSLQRSTKTDYPSPGRMNAVGGRVSNAEGTATDYPLVGDIKCMRFYSSYDATVRALNLAVDKARFGLP